MQTVMDHSKNTPMFDVGALCFIIGTINPVRTAGWFGAGILDFIGYATLNLSSKDVRWFDISVNIKEIVTKYLGIAGHCSLRWRKTAHFLALIFIDPFTSCEISWILQSVSCFFTDLIVGLRTITSVSTVSACSDEWAWFWSVSCHLSWIQMHASKSQQFEAFVDLSSSVILILDCLQAVWDVGHS